MPVSGACVEEPPTIQPASGAVRHDFAVVPIQAAPLQPHCSSQNTLSLLVWFICHVMRSPLASVAPSLLAWVDGSGSNVHAFGLPAFRLANIPVTDVLFPYDRPR